MHILSVMLRRIGVVSFLTLAIAIIHSCNFFSPVSEVSPDKFPWRASSKLVVGCFISPQDSVVRVSLTESNPLYDTLKQSSILINARIVLYNKSDSLVISDTLSGYYMASKSHFLIAGGETYKLVVKTVDGRTVSATCTVPEQPVPITAIVIDSGFVRTVTVGNDPVDSTIERYASIQWKDPIGANYYRVLGQLNQSENIHETDKNVIKTDFTKLLYFNEENSRTMILNDKNQENGKMQSADGIYWTGNYRGEVVRQEIVMYLLNTDKTYYDYYQSINQYSKADGNPFAEPINVIGNINGGYGCFAAFNRSSITFKIK